MLCVIRYFLYEIEIFVKLIIGAHSQQQVLSRPLGAWSPSSVAAVSGVRCRLRSPSPSQTVRSGSRETDGVHLSHSRSPPLPKERTKRIMNQRFRRYQALFLELAAITAEDLSPRPHHPVFAPPLSGRF